MTVATVFGSTGCKPRATVAVADAGPVASAAAAPVAAAATVPVPPEPTPPLASKAGDAPALEAKLVADPAYADLWLVRTESADRRHTLMTAVSDFLAYGTLHTGTDAALKRAKLSGVFDRIQKIFWRTGALPGDFQTRVEVDLRGWKPGRNMGVWQPRAGTEAPLDETALAMWLHPNDGDYVRQRMLALLQGPFAGSVGGPASRPWLADLAKVIDRLRDLGAFGKADCDAVAGTWKEAVSPTTGERTVSCVPNAAKAAAAFGTKGGAESDWHPMQVGDDGRMMAVDMYVPTTLKDPDSYDFVRCTPATFDGSFWVATCSWRAKNSFGAVVPDTQRFYIQKGGAVGEGQVVRTSKAP